MNFLKELQEEIKAAPQNRSFGQVTAINAQTITAQIPRASITDLCYIQTRNSHRIPAEVVAFEGNNVKLAPLESPSSITPGATVENTEKPLSIKLHDGLQGQILNALGESLGDFANSFEECGGIEKDVFQAPPPPLKRKPIETILKTGIASIDNFCTLGYGQRIGLFAGAGVGKSTLLGMIARNADVDVIVIALVGERGREVKEFIEDSLGEEGLKKSILVVATSDEPAPRRKLAPYTATTIAEYFRDQGKRVLLLVDSLTRMARAIREVGLTAGEIPVRHGYPTSLYIELPKLLERAGTSERGSITAIYTVLQENPNQTDPLVEEVKSILDGHILLSQKIAERGIRPAVDLLNSISRLVGKLVAPSSLKKRADIIKMIARLEKDKDILLFGGTPDAELQAALDAEKSINQILNQSPYEHINQEELEAKITQISTRSNR
ncbi:MAG: FliI/YscN family ATPase [Deltaproteobacteria bacterium]|nr:FliI/YscN family ATPase [Deltaproteobacteria bacterium]